MHGLQTSAPSTLPAYFNVSSVKFDFSFAPMARPPAASRRRSWKLDIQTVMSSRRLQFKFGSCAVVQ